MKFNKELKEALDVLEDFFNNTGSHSSSLEFAKGYFYAIDKSAKEYGSVGVQTQLMYLLCNLRCWRGEDAKKTKLIFKKYTTKDPELKFVKEKL